MACSSLQTALSLVPSRVQPLRNRLLQWVPHGVTGPCQQMCSRVGSSLPGPAPAQASHGLSLLQCGGGPLWATGASLFQLNSTGLQGNLNSSPWSTSWPSFITGMGVCRVAPLTYSLAVFLQFFPPTVGVPQGRYHHG